MTAAAPVPVKVADAVGLLVGDVEGWERLGGLSGRVVVAAHGPRATVVAKGPVGPAEHAVATTLAAPFAARGVPSARCLAVVPSDDGPWLVLEHLPQPLPRERWGADAEVVGTLRALHAAPPSLLDGVPGRYEPRWDRALTDAAASALRLSPAEKARVDAHRALAPALFRPERLVSGDPNPLNWRLDDAGRPVLLDWERLTLASPAVDLAIVLPGFPDADTVRTVRAAYGPGAPPAEQVVAAKVWTVVELAGRAPDGAPAADAVEAVREPFLAWVDALERPR